MTGSTDLPRPRQGDIWLTAFGTARLGEPGKTRPALIISADGLIGSSAFDLVMVAPISASLTPTQSRPAISATLETGLTTDSVVVVRAVRNLSRTRLLQRLGAADASLMAGVQEILVALLGLP